MKYLIDNTVKGILGIVSFALVMTIVLSLFGAVSEFSWSYGPDRINIISVTDDGNGNADLTLGEKSIVIKRTTFDELRLQLAKLLTGD